MDSFENELIGLIKNRTITRYELYYNFNYSVWQVRFQINRTGKIRTVEGSTPEHAFARAIESIESLAGLPSQPVNYHDH